MKFKSLILAAGLLAFNASATIIENDSILANSFKDTDTGLVWMDFGVNNGRSYNEVVSHLGVGGDYYGWRLPTFAEVYVMWTNLANLSNVIASYENPNQFGPGQLYSSSNNSDVVGGDDSPWEATFNVVGRNSTSSTLSSSGQHAVGVFAGAGGFAYVAFTDFTDMSADNPQYSDTVELFDNNLNGRNAHYADFRITQWSTLLVAPTVRTPDPVGAPSSIALFALALLGLGVKRRRKA